LAAYLKFALMALDLQTSIAPGTVEMQTAPAMIGTLCPQVRNAEHEEHK
jgi:hypothetical protein